MYDLVSHNSTEIRHIHALIRSELHDCATFIIHISVKANNMFNYMCNNLRLQLFLGRSLLINMSAK